MDTLATVAVPDHIPREIVRDLDYFRPPGGREDLLRAWKRVQDEVPDIFWTPRNGGHWVMTRSDDIRALQADHERFSYRIINLPPDPDAHKLLPVAVDPPEHTPFRAAIMPAFLPRAIDKLDQSLRRQTAELVEALAPRGECEFLEDFARQVPIAIFLQMVELPVEDAPRLKRLADIAVRSQDRTIARGAQSDMMDYLRGWIEARRARPGDDLISSAVQARVDGRPITETETLNLLTSVMLGGLDTVSSMFGFVAEFLATHPEHRRDLVAHPQLRRNAVEELIRRHGVVNNGRVIVQDFEHKGLRFKAGDRALVVNLLSGLDERVNPDPMTVDFRRENPQHAAFGAGPHTCPGAVLARREISAFLEFWLGGIPEFELKPGASPVMTGGPINWMQRLDLVWDPATRRSAA